MKQYFIEQEASNAVYEEQDFLNDVELRRAIYTYEELNAYCERAFRRIGQRPFYLIVCDPNDISGHNGKPKQELIKVFEHDLERFAPCLSITYERKFPTFNIMDMETYKAAYADCKITP